MTTPAPPVTDHDDFERRLLELRVREKAHTRAIPRTDEQGTPVGARGGGRPAPQWTRVGVTGVGHATT